MQTSTVGSDIDTLHGNKAVWARLPIADKIGFLDSVASGIHAQALAWVEAACEAKGFSIDDPRAGEEWTSGPAAALWLIRDLRVTLVRLASGVPVLAGYSTRALGHGQIAVDVFPTLFDESFLFSGVTAEVWMEPEVTLDNLDDSTAGLYRSGDNSAQGAVTLVLGAGNVSSIPILDVLHVLFNQGRVALLKMNPINAYLGPIFEEIFADLIEAGYVRFAHGDAATGAALTTHEHIDAIHVTGSASTYNSIVYGDGPEGEANRIADRPINTRPVTAELGGVSPVIVVPGKWTRRDVRFQAEHIVSQKLHNGGFNCVAAQVLVLPKMWDQADDLLDAIRAVLSAMDDRRSYYPGSADRCVSAVATSSGVEVYGDEHPRYLVTGLDPEDATSPWFTDEIFGPVLAVTSVAGDDVPTYLRNAVAFANETLAGTLGANLLVDPASSRSHSTAIEVALRDLEYGTIAVNAWSGVAYSLSKCPWGAFREHSDPSGTERRTDIGSGTGVVHNSLMFDRATKSIVRGPFAPAPRTLARGEFHIAPKMVYFVTNRQSHSVGRKLVEYLAHPSRRKLAGVALSALRG